MHKLALPAAPWPEIKQRVVLRQPGRQGLGIAVDTGFGIVEDQWQRSHCRIGKR